MIESWMASQDLAEALVATKAAFFVGLFLYFIGYCVELRFSSKSKTKLPYMVTLVPIVLFFISYCFIYMVGSDSQGILMRAALMYAATILCLLPTFIISKYAINRKIKKLRT